MNPFIGETKNPFSTAKIISENTPPAVYHRTGADIERGKPEFVMSRSELRNFASCPMRWVRGYENGEDTKSSEWGTLIDALYLGHAEGTFAVCPETYPDTGMECPVCGSVTDSKKCAKCKTDRVEKTFSKPWKFGAKHTDEWKERQGDRLIVKHDVFADAERAMTILLSDSEAKALQEQSQKQVFVMAEYRDVDTGLVISFKVLLDIVPHLTSHWPKSLWDFKTSVTAQPRMWGKTVHSHGLHWQAASYLHAYVAATGEDRCDFRHLIQESQWPFYVDRYKAMLSSEFFELGAKEYTVALKEYCQCLKTGDWTGYTCQKVIDNCMTIEPEAYMVGK